MAVQNVCTTKCTCHFSALHENILLDFSKGLQSQPMECPVFLTNTLQEWLQCPKTFLIRHFLTLLDTNLHFRAYANVASKTFAPTGDPALRETALEKSSTAEDPTCLTIF